MSRHSGEILEIDKGTPWGEGLGIACRTTDPLGKIQVFYLPDRPEHIGCPFALYFVGLVAMVATDADENTEVIGHD